ncbi:hypothetical protein EV586_101399 [Tumebacillus sp. BK434]|uniref:hypothetical protein n=1 Tax=Tumebacillus sp. BK434 TaxID=2512169 RepID=UPI001048E8E4|nr:hypothetical protein [Tumebacillus sp. BK434]TCP59183.1 hypothetical protein EV586_101399 [Tumebacillus sp. BK434]
MKGLTQFSKEEEVDDLLAIDYAEEQLSLSDVQELLHECRHSRVLLHRVPSKLPWGRLGALLGWKVHVQASPHDEEASDVCFYRL